MKTYVVGHKNPDTDSVVSAIALATLLGETPAVAGSLNKETIYLLDRFGFQVPALVPAVEKKVFLVDHNEPAQMHENIRVEEIKGVFDHHKLGGLSTAEPVKVDVWPVGSTATLVASLYDVSGCEMETNMAAILLGAIASDTLKLTSPTTTDEDRKWVAKLEHISKVDIGELADGLFAAKSDISDMTTDELIGKDYKIFDLAGRRVGIGVWETVSPEAVLGRKEEILVAIGAKKVEDSLDYILFAVIDILNQKGDFIVVGEPERALAEAAFGGKAVKSTLECPGILSRKKQIVPAIEKYLASSK